MANYYPMLTLVSVVLFAGLGFFLARRRNANGIIWAVLGGIFPPVLLVMFFLKPGAAPEAGADEGELDEG